MSAIGVNPTASNDFFVQQTDVHWTRILLMSSIIGNIDPSRNVFIIPRTTDYIIPNNQAKIELEILNYMNPNSQLHDLLSNCENSLVQSAFDVLDYTATDDIRSGGFRC